VLVTLLTDFGTADYFVAAMKGVILGRDPRIALVDVTHEVPPQDVPAGAFTLLAAYPAFPAGTVHLAVVDPGVGSERRPLVVDAGGHRFVGPDNGLLSYVCEREPQARVYHLTGRALFREPVSATFHGRDVFAPAAAALATGAAPAELGAEVDDYVRLDPLRPVRVEGKLRARILHVDRFGNCVTNIGRQDLPECEAAEEVRMEVNGREVRTLRRFYAEPGAEDGEPFAIWGSAGFLEISVQRDSAAELLGVRRGMPVTVRMD